MKREIQELMEKFEGIKMLAELHQQVLKLMNSCPSCEEHECCSNEVEEDLTEEEIENLENYYSDYEKMFNWAFDLNIENELDKEEMMNKWMALHPKLPKLFLPEHIENSTANMLIMMQVIPHWSEYKKIKEQYEKR